MPCFDHPCSNNLCLCVHIPFKALDTQALCACVHFVALTRLLLRYLRLTSSSKLVIVLSGLTLTLVNKRNALVHDLAAFLLSIPRWAKLQNVESRWIARCVEKTFSQTAIFFFPCTSYGIFSPYSLLHSSFAFSWCQSNGYRIRERGETCNEILPSKMLGRTMQTKTQDRGYIFETNGQCDWNLQLDFFRLSHPENLPFELMH